MTVATALAAHPAAAAAAAREAQGVHVVGTRSVAPVAQRSASPKSRVVRSSRAKKPSVARVKKSRSRAKVRSRARVVAVPAVASVGMLTGLHQAEDPLNLQSAVALVVDQQNNEVLLSKNSGAVLPIASITKLMTALVVIESGLPLEQELTISEADAELTSNSRSRLVPGTSMSRAEMLHLALMSSENRAAQALSRHYPGGTDSFVAAMNLKAQQLGMHDTRFVEPTGLSSDNRASAKDLTLLVAAASGQELIREYSTAKESRVPVGSRERMVEFRSTNGLIGKPEWDISLQKTGYIAAAGRCLVMQATLAGRQLTMVLLDSAGRYSRFSDAERIRKWVLSELPAATAR